MTPAERRAEEINKLLYHAEAIAGEGYSPIWPLLSAAMVSDAVKRDPDTFALIKAVREAISQYRCGKAQDDEVDLAASNLNEAASHYVGLLEDLYAGYHYD